jgi:hypothetical protein
MMLIGNDLEVMDMNYKTTSYMVPMSLGKHFSLLLIAILVLLLAACGGSDGGNNGSASANKAQCNLSQSEIDNLTPDDVLPANCDFLRALPLVGLFILGTEIDAAGDLKLYVNGVKRNGTPMILTDFVGAAVTVGGVTVNRPADWNVVAAGGDVLSLVTLADYSSSISTADLIGMGDLYDVVLEEAPTGFEAETINFSTNPTAPYIVVKPDPLPHWTTELNGPLGLLAANDYDVAFPNVNTPLYDAMGTGLMGPLANAGVPGADNLGLVERNRPATLLMVQSDGVDNASVDIGEDALVSLMDRCHTTAIMLGTFQLDSDIDQILEGRAVLERLAGRRGAFVNGLNASFLEEIIEPFAKSLGNLVVFTLNKETNFADKIVRIEVDSLAASATEPFDIDGSCQI